MLTLLSITGAESSYAQTSGTGLDLTSYISNSTCSSITDWNITGGNSSTSLQLDTWSTRGSKDGSNMTTPFLEYWVGTSSAPLADASIRHTTVHGLPQGTYRLSVHVRLYDERGRYRPSGAKLYANGIEVDIPSNTTAYTYNSQYACNGIVTVEFPVGANGNLDFGFNVRNANFNWLAFKDVKLIYLNSSDLFVDAAPGNVVINEIMSANIDMFFDPAFCYGGFIELYNPTDKYVNLSGAWIIGDETKYEKFQLPHTVGIIPPHGFHLVWFDHNAADGFFSSAAVNHVPFKLDCDGGTLTILSSDGSLIASQTYPKAISRASYSRTTDGGLFWGYTATPTPAATNTTSLFSSVQLPAPEVDTDGTLFTGSLSVNVTIPSSCTLRYTTDGSTPTLTHGHTSTDGHFSINNSTVFRFRLFQDGKIPSPVVTRSFILRDQNYTLPVLSVVIDETNLYDTSVGLFAKGPNGRVSGNETVPCNFFMDWERPSNFEYFTLDGRSVLNQESDFVMVGGYSRGYTPHSFKLKASKQYEEKNTIDYPVFSAKPYNRLKSLHVRNAGRHRDKGRIMDVALQEIIRRSGLYVDLQVWQPAHVFINGKYYAMLNLREPSNKVYGYSNYGIDTDYMDQFELNMTYGYQQKVGTDEAWKRLLTLSETAADSESYREISDLLDIEEFINYMAIEIFVGNDDWLNQGTTGNNVKAFRGFEPGDKFHFVLFDIDHGYITYNIFSRIDSYGKDRCGGVGYFFRNLLNNAQFRRQFIDSYCLLIGSVFRPERCHAILNEINSIIAPALALEGYTSNENLTYLINQITEKNNAVRLDNMHQYQAMKLSSVTGQHLTLDVSHPGAHLLFNGLPVPTDHFSGTVFPPVSLQALAPAGCSFRGWADADGNIVSTESTYSLPEKTDLSLTAVFEESTPVSPVCVNEVSSDNGIFACTDYWKKDDWVELYNTTSESIDLAGMYLSDDASQPQKYQIPLSTSASTVLEPHSHLVVWASKRVQNADQLHANFKLSNLAGESVTLTSHDGTWSNTLTYSAQSPRQSVGRYPDGSSDIYIFSNPSIAAPNRLTANSSFLYNLPAEEGTEAQFTLRTTSGWNWISHPLDTDIPTTLITANAERLLSQTDELFLDPEFGWTGSISALSPKSGYKILMNSDQVVTLSADALCSSLPIPLRKGWNWIGYPLTQTQPLYVALSGFRASEGDIVMGQYGFATYEGNKWVGTLDVLTPGAGYLYYSASPKSLLYHQSETSTQARAPFRPQPHTLWSADASSYPDVMGVIAQLMVDGMTDDDCAYSVAAFSEDGECRGVGRYVDGKLFITIHGETGDVLKFHAFNPETGIIADINEVLTFVPDLKGSVSQPLILHVGEATSIAATPNSKNQKINNSITYWTLDGRSAGTHRNALTPGIYVARTATSTGAVVTNKIIIK